MSSILTLFFYALVAQLFFCLLELSLNKLRITPLTRVFSYKLGFLFLFALPFILWLSQSTQELSYFKAIPLDELPVVKLNEVIKQGVNFSWTKNLILSYFTISALFIIKIFFSYLKTVKTLKSAIKGRVHGHEVYFANISSPFCFGLLKCRVYWPKKISLENLHQEKVALAHELNHAKNKDSMWMLLAMIVKSFLWISPLSYLMMKRFELLIEENCDAQTIEQKGISCFEYGEILLKLAVNQNQYLTQTSLNHTDLKKRILTIKSRTIKMKHLKLVLIAFSTLFAFSIAAVNNHKVKSFTPLYLIDQTITIDNLDIFDSRVIVRDGLEGLIEMEKPDGVLMLKIKASGAAHPATGENGAKLQMALRSSHEGEFEEIPTIFAGLNQDGELSYMNNEGKNIKIKFKVIEKEKI